MKKIIFIEPKAPNLHIFSMFALPRLGTFILATMMKNRGWDASVIFEETGEIDFNIIKKADLVGISTITSTATRAYAIADKIREMGVTVIMGGPHVTFLAEEALQHSDFVLRGEGEIPLMKFIDQWEGSRDFTKVPGLSFLQNGSIAETDSVPYIKNMDLIPYPDPALLKKHLAKLGGRYTIPVQTSRGCPFNCSFCSVTGMFGKKYRFRSTENIIEELRNYNHNKNVIFFYDDNFTANRERAKELCKAMIKENFKFKWSTQVRVDIAKDEELVGLMKKSGCHTLYIGFESVNPESLKEMQKSQSVEDIKSAIKILKKYKIHIHGMFVYGFDTDTEGSIRETLKFAKSSGISSAQFLILTPLPGSATYNALKNQGRIKFKEWSLYDAHHVVFEPVNLTMAQLQHAQIESHQKFYSFTQIVKHILAFRWLDLGIAYYARNLNRVWKKRNRIFLKIVDLLTPKKGVRISIDYRTDVNLEPQKRVA